MDRTACDLRLLTAKATKSLAKIDQPLVEMHKRLLAGLSGGELRELSDLLEKIRTSFPDEPGRPLRCRRFGEDACHRAAERVGVELGAAGVWQIVDMSTKSGLRQRKADCDARL